MLDGEKDIILRAITGEASAFGLLYDHYQPQIYRFVYLKVSHREEAEDLTHQVFLQGWQGIAAYHYEALPFSSWLYRIARNKVIDYYRVRKIHIPVHDLELAAETEGIAPLDRALDMKRVRRALALLKPIEQDVVILRFIEELPVKETARALQKTPLAVKLIQHRALKHLKTFIATP